MGKHRTIGKISPGDHVQHLAGWTGNVVDVEQVTFGRRLLVGRDDLPSAGAEWWRETAFTRIQQPSQ